MVYDSTYSAIKAVNKALGYEALKYDSTYSAAKALLLNLGGEDKNYDSLYSIMSELAKMAEEGQIGGGGSGVTISDQELLEESVYENYSEGKYARTQLWDNSYILFQFTGQIHPCLSDNELGGLLPELTYNTDSQSFEYVKNEDGDTAGFLTSSIWETVYLPKLRRKEYVWSAGDDLEDLYTPASPGLVPNHWNGSDSNGVQYSILDFSNAYNYYNYGVRKGVNGYPLPYDYMVDVWKNNTPIYLHYNGGGYYSSRNYNDEVGMNYPVYGKEGVEYAPYGFGDHMPEAFTNYDKFVYTSQDPITCWDRNKTMVSIKKLLSRNDIVFDNNIIINSLYNNDEHLILNTPIDINASLIRTKDTDAYISLRDNYYITGFRLNNEEDQYPNRKVSFSFNSCASLKFIDIPETVKFTSDSGAFNSASSLESISLVDASEWSSSVTFPPSLIHIGGFKDLKVGQSWGFLDYCPNLTVQSLMNVINNLYDLTANGLSGQTLKFGSTNLNKLTADQIAIATNKGWTLN